MRCLLSWVLFGIMVGLGHGFAAPAGGAASEIFELGTKEIVAAGEGPADANSLRIRMDVLKAWGTEHTFEPPAGWKATADAKNKELVVREEGGGRGLIVVRRVEPAGAQPSSAEAWGQRLLGLHAGLELNNGKTGRAVGTPWGKGHLYELSVPGNTAGREAVMALWVATPHGTLGFELRGTAYGVRQLGPTFLRLVNSFVRLEERAGGGR